jgi:hypothetical protein
MAQCPFSELDIYSFDTETSMGNAYKILFGKPERTRRLGVDGMIILKWIFLEQDVGVWTRSSGSCVEFLLHPQPEDASCRGDKGHT